MGHVTSVTGILIRLLVEIFGSRERADACFLTNADSMLEEMTVEHVTQVHVILRSVEWASIVHFRRVYDQ
jgi:hypothetical protein